LICVKCGHSNPPNQNFCEKCNASLPKIVEQSKIEVPLRVNERFNQLKEAGDKVLSGEWTVEQFAEFLEHIYQILVQKEQEIREIEIPQETFDDFRDELETGFAGIELYNQGLAEMNAYVQDLNSEHIEYGLQLVNEGNEKINEAMRINRENRQKLEEMHIDNSDIV